MDITSTLKLFQIDGIIVPNKTQIKEIGSGAYGRVLEVTASCAAKELHAKLIGYASCAGLEKLKQSFLQECVQCSKLYHPNIVQFLGVYYPSEDATLPWLMMEKLDVSLFHYLEKNEVNEVPFAKKISILHDVAQGLHYLHSLDIVHRDLSSKNILLTKSLIAKIADLGVAKLIKDSTFSKTHTPAPGTAVFMPPEALRIPPRYGKPVDIFSLACVSLHLVTHEFPLPLDETYFDKESSKKIARLETERREKYLVKLLAFPKLRELTLNCLNDIPEKRPEIDDVYVSIKEIAPELQGYAIQTVLSEKNYHIKELQVQLKQLQDDIKTVTAENRSLKKQAKEHTKETPFTVALPPKPRKIAPEIIPYCTEITKSSDKLQIFQMNLHIRMSSASQRITKKHFYGPVTSATSSHYPGSRLPKHHSITGSSEKVLMVVGATGAGKTTLINGMINYILGVEWTDNFRFKLITDETTQNQAHSQTQKITAYTMHHFKGSPVGYTLTIIDTPSFGDTRGLERDKVIVDQIRELFSLKGTDGIDHLDGIGFVTQSSVTRLTPTQKYIFDSILSVFGKDVANNIFILITFADGSKPPVLDAIAAAKIPHQQKYKFNNSAIFGSDEDDNSFSQMFWVMGFKSFKKFFDGFSKAKGVSLSMTQEVLQKRERERLHTTVQGFRPQIDNGLAKMVRMRQEITMLEKHQAEITANRNFTIKIKVPKYVKIDVEQGKYVTNCQVCNFTCHSDCAFANDEDKIRCSAMNNGKCTVCKGKCDWHLHKNMKFFYDSIMEDCVITFDDLKRKYNSAVNGKNRQENMIKNLEKEFAKVKAEVKSMVREVQKNLSRLDQIALKPNPLTETDHLNLLIESEKQQKSPGYQQRIQFYEEAKRETEILKKAQTGYGDFLQDDEEAPRAAQSSIRGELDHLNLLIESEKQQKSAGYQQRIQFYEEAKRDADFFKKALTGYGDFLQDDEEAPRAAQSSTWGNLMNYFKQ